MTAHDAVSAFINTLIDIEVKKLLPLAAHLVPGEVGTLVAGALALPEVQEAIERVEQKAVGEVLAWAFTELGKLQTFLQAHISVKVQTLLIDTGKVLAAGVHLTAEEVQAFAQAIAAGKWQDIRHAAGLP